MSENIEHEHVPAVQADYFGFGGEEKFYFPDKITWVSLKLFNEGKKSDFQKKTSKDLVMEAKSGNTRMALDQSSERHELLVAAITDWNLTRNGSPLPYSEAKLRDFLYVADPRIVEDIEKAIKRMNPWMLGDVKAADIREEIKRLQEELRIAEEREAGEDSSSGK